MSEYKGLKYNVEVDDVRDEPPYRNLAVEVWKESDGFTDEVYALKKFFRVTRKLEGLYLVEDISDQIYEDRSDQSPLVRDRGEIAELEISDFSQSRSSFAEEIIDSLDLE